jgi:hypothetical protein
MNLNRAVLYLGCFGIGIIAGLRSLTDGKGNVHGVDVINFGWGGILRTYVGRKSSIASRCQV